MTLLKNTLGYSLAEMMVAVGISGIVVLGIGELITSYVQNTSAITNTTDSDEEALRLQYFFSLPLRTAVNVMSSTASINASSIVGVGATAFQGVLQENFDSGDGIHPNDGLQTNAIMLFEHDTSAIVGGLAASKFEPMGIYFQQPSQTTYGMLYINGLDSTGRLSPQRNGFTVGNITRVAISNVVKDTNGYVRSFMITVSMRYPTSDSQTPIVWCPTSFPCGQGGPAKDVVHSFTVNLPNNHLPTDDLESGRVYFIGR